ncbi:MAG: VPLPA-CTERM-specific exosortase XrtD [Pseudomonadota bacterium]
MSSITQDRNAWMRNPGFWLFALATAAAFAVFWYGFESLATAWATPEYSHGPLIPLLSLYLFLRQLKGLAPATEPVTDRWPGVILIAAALGIATIGNLARIPDIVTYAMILWIFGAVLVCFGWKRGFQFWPPVLHLVFMLPLPAFIYWQVSIQLQFISSEIGVALIRLMEIPVFLDGNIIDLGIYKLHVAEACSGLRYLFPVMSFSYIFAVLYQGPIWHKAVLLLSAAPITVLMNSFRIGVIGVMVNQFGISYAEGFLHLFEGWVIFVSCVVILFGLARLMQRINGDRRPLGEALDLDLAGLGPQAARVTAVVSSTALVVMTLVTAAVAGAWHGLPERAPVVVDRDPLVLFPRELGDWRSGSRARLDPQIEAVLGANDYYGSNFTSPAAPAPVDLFIAWYDKQTDGSGIHSPEVCIPAGGWEMSQITEAPLSMTLDDGSVAAFSVNRAVIQKGLSQQLVYYWFEGRGRRMTSDYVAKAATVYDGVTIGRSDGALVRLITPILAGESESAADARLQAMLGETLEVLPRFIPGV